MSALTIYALLGVVNDWYLRPAGSVTRKHYDLFLTVTIDSFLRCGDCLRKFRTQLERKGNPVSTEGVDNLAAHSSSIRLSSFSSARFGCELFAFNSALSCSVSAFYSPATLLASIL